jgi:hypothetical protein
MTRTNRPPVADTVNPAGEPKVRIAQHDDARYTRSDFMRDLGKASKKQPPKKR